MATNPIKKLSDLADKLYDIRQIITKKEEANKIELEALKAEREIIQKQLLDSMNKNGLASLKVKSGDTFAKSVRKSVEIVNEVFALQWALKHNAVSVNKVVAGQIIKDSPEIPKGFALNETEYISVRKAKKED